MSRSPDHLNEKQLQVLSWVERGCPDGEYFDDNYGHFLAHLIAVTRSSRPAPRPTPRKSSSRTLRTPPRGAQSSSRRVPVAVLGTRYARRTAAFDTLKRGDRQRQGALARWLGRIMSAWGVDQDMPYPEGRDAEILADVIPFALEATQPRGPRRAVT